MFNSVQYVRDLCKERKIAISLLEKECGFANGYLNPKKMAKISYDRAVVIAEYLGVPAEDILNGPNDKKTPVPKKDERDVSEIMFALSRGGEQEITDEMFDEVKKFAAYIAQREKDRK